MEKGADTADTSMLFFPFSMLIFCLCTRKLARITVLIAMC